MKLTLFEKICLGLLQVIGIAFLVFSFPIQWHSLVGIFSFLIITIFVLGLSTGSKKDEL